MPDVAVVHTAVLRHPYEVVHVLLHGLQVVQRDLADLRRASDGFRRFFQSDVHRQSIVSDRAEQIHDGIRITDTARSTPETERRRHS
ncbi:hypothetical protein DEA98_10410 [Brucella pseudogrignonensis]|nr:hypothetical protein [Brucella pseudogrignonensis]